MIDDSSRKASIIYEIHKINHELRNSSFLIKTDPRFHDESLLLEEEKEVTASISSRIAEVFYLLTHRRCFVAIYLLTGENKCTILAQSDGTRRKEREFEYDTIEDQNSDFYYVLSHGAHYLGKRLKKLKKQGYKNARMYWG